MRRIGNVCCLVLFAGSLMACAYTSPQQQEANACKILGPKAMIGALGGAAGGAAIGAAADGGQGAAIGAGLGLLTGLVGGHIADQQDCQAAQKALAENLETARNGSTITWQSPSGHSGQYQVSSDAFAAHNSTDCRMAQSVPAPGSTDNPQNLVACRMPDGDYSYYPS